jgi:hypothetical protein
MKKKSLLHRFKKYNTIKLVTLLLLLVLPIIGILAYDKRVFEGMVINIYGSPNGSGKISTSNDNNRNSQKISTPSTRQPVAKSTPTQADAKKTSVQPDTTSANAKARAKWGLDPLPITTKTSSYTSAFTNPLAPRPQDTPTSTSTTSTTSTTTPTPT